MARQSGCPYARESRHFPQASTFYPLCCHPLTAHLPACSGKAGVTVGGKLEGGALCPGSKVLLMPAGQPATVK